jgi:hypothetical protein
MGEGSRIMTYEGEVGAKGAYALRVMDTEDKNSPYQHILP